MGYALSLSGLTSAPDPKMGAKYLSRLGAANSQNLAQQLIREVLIQFSIDEAIYQRERLGKAGVNFGFSLLYAVIDSGLENKASRLDALRRFGERTENEMMLQKYFGHLVFVEAFRGLLESYSLFYLCSQSRVERDDVGEIVSSIADMIALIALVTMEAGGSCDHLEKILKAVINKTRLGDFILSMDLSSVDRLKRDIYSSDGEPILNKDLLGGYKEYEAEIWKAKFWELFKFYQKAVQALRQATIPQVITRPVEDCRPRILPPLAVRRDVRAALGDLQGRFC